MTKIFGKLTIALCILITIPMEAAAQTNPFGIFQQLKQTAETLQNAVEKKPQPTSASVPDSQNAVAAPGGGGVTSRCQSIVDKGKRDWCWNEEAAQIRRGAPDYARKQVDSECKTNNECQVYAYYKLMAQAKERQAAENNRIAALQSKDADYCDRFMSNPTISRFVNILDKATELRGDDTAAVFTSFDKKDELFKWVANKWRPLPQNDKDHILATVNECALSLARDDTKALAFTEGSMIALREMRKGLLRVQERASKSESKLDDSGKRVNVQAAGINWKKDAVILDKLGSGSSGGNHFPIAAFALFFQGGEQALASVGENYFAAAEPALQQLISYKESEKVSADKYAAELKKQADEKAARKAARDVRIQEIKKGNLKVAKSCTEIAVIADQNDYQPSVNATNKLVFGDGNLEKFQLNGVNGEGYAKSDTGQYALIKANKDTIWLDKENVKIGSTVVFVGKYTANINVRLTSGASQQAPVLDLLCIQSGASMLSDVLSPR